MSWIRKLWPKRGAAKSQTGLGGALAPIYGQDLQHPDEFINRANKRAVKGDLEGAIADFDAAIEMNPAKATAFYNRAYLHNLAGQHAQAIADCTDAIALLPDYDEAYYQRGLAQLELGNLKAAGVDLSEVLRLNPYSIKAYYKRAHCYAQQDDIQGAVADYTQAILRVPKDANAYYQRGLFLTKLQEYRTAIEDFSSALSFNPKHADSYYHRGYCYAELGETEKATRDFNQAMLYDPSQRVADYNRTYALGILKDSKQLPSAQATPPSSVMSDEPVVLSFKNESRPFELGDPQVLDLPDLEFVSPRDTSSETPPVQSQPLSPPEVVAQAAHFPESSEHLQEFTESYLGPESFGQIDRLFAQAQELAQSGQFEQAIQAYSQIIQSQPANSRAYLERGKTLEALGQEQAAASDLDAAVHWAKQKSLDLIKDYSGSLAETLADLKRDLARPPQRTSALVSQDESNQSIEGAILKYSQQIHRNPLDAKAYFERAKSRALLGDLEGAIADYTRTITLDDHNRDAYYKRGVLLAALGDVEGATQDMNKAILRKPLLPASRPPVDVVAQAIEDAAVEPSIDVPVTESAVTSPVETDSEIPLSVAEDLDEMSEDETILWMDQSPQPQPDLVQTSMENETETEAEAEGMEPELMQGSENPPTYFTDLVLEPCNHEGNDPANRFCIHCGQLIHSTLE